MKPSTSTSTSTSISLSISRPINKGLATIAALISVAGLLAACSGSNPLRTADTQTAVEALAKAQFQALKKMQFADFSEMTYYNCAVNPANYDNPFDKKAINPCQQFRKTLVEYLALAPAPFNQLSVSDVTDNVAAHRLHDAFAQYTSSSTYYKVKQHL